MQEYSHHPSEGNAIGMALPFLVLAVLLFAYLRGVSRQHRAGRRWSRLHTASFAGGLALLAVAVLPPLVQFGHEDIRGHMVQHLLVGMLAPLGLVLGAPVSLALRVLPVRATRFVTAILRNPGFHLLSHPLSALILNIGGMYLLYLTPLYKATLTNPGLHLLVHIHFFAAGYLFAWSIAGPDPAPKRPSLLTRVVVLFFSIASHAYLSKFMYAYLFPRNSPHSEEQIREAAMLMYYGGDFAEVLLAVALFSLWYRKRGRPHFSMQPLLS